MIKSKHLLCGHVRVCMQLVGAQGKVGEVEAGANYCCWVVGDTEQMSN